jgi:hypothetical protein
MQTSACAWSSALAVQNKDLPRFAIVSEKPYLKRLLIAVAVAWMLLVLAWGWFFWRDLGSDSGRLRAAVAAAEAGRLALEKENARLKQELAIAQRADFISRSANNQIQESLADKEERIAGLKADLDFYERLVGSGGRRQGLNVHDAEFVIGSAGAWQYTITLTQNINRGGMSTGRMQFAIEGVSGGKLRTLAWNELVQDADAPGQSFSFRYFQALQGTVMLPAGFSPQRVKVSLKGASGTSEQTFSWKQVKASPADAPPRIP